jgi:hypothetical protein
MTKQQQGINDLEDWLTYYDDVHRRLRMYEEVARQLEQVRKATAPLIDSRRTQIDHQTKVSLARIANVRATEAMNTLNRLMGKAREELEAIKQEVLP